MEHGQDTGLGIIRGHSTYVLTRLIAQGGMGAVYEARQLGAEGFVKTMAVKTILPKYTSNAEFVDMFIGEAKLVANLVHENIVQIYQLGHDQDGNYYIAMEFMYGINLEEFLDKHIELDTSVPVELVCFIVSRVARGLQYAHAKRGEDGALLNIVHRDVSPKNVLINTEGVVRLTDFGVAKAKDYMDRSDEGEVLMGKAEYMSPEQANYEVTDARSDIFSLGIVFYELLTGRNIFLHDDVYETLDRVLSCDIPDPREFRPDIPEEVSRIVLTAMTRSVEDRYQTAGRIGYELEYHMYSGGYGPTNVTLANYLATLYPGGDFGAPRDPAGDFIDPYSDTIYTRSSEIVPNQTSTRIAPDGSDTRPA